jgi:hypothetical protein
MASAENNIPYDTDDVTVLRFCRCQDCTRLSVDQTWAPDGMACRCQAGHTLTGIVWGTGKAVTQPAPEQWHYCQDYAGPVVVDDLIVWPKGRAQVRQSDVHVPVQMQQRVVERKSAPLAKARNEPGLFDQLAAKQDRKVKVY